MFASGVEKGRPRRRSWTSKRREVGVGRCGQTRKGSIEMRIGDCQLGRELRGITGAEFEDTCRWADFYPSVRAP